MRSVSFVDYLEFEFSGNILDRGLALGDVDNDGGSELVVANVAGDMAIFKGKTTKPWRKYSRLGMIACIVVGDICNIHQNVVFSITSEGWCHLMWFGDKAKSDSSEPVSSKPDVVSIYHQSLPTNSKIALLADVDGDGEMELVIGSTDRVVRVFKWIKEPPKNESEDLNSSDQTLVKQRIKGNIQKQNSKEEKGLFRKTEMEDQHDFKTAADDTCTSSRKMSHESSQVRLHPKVDPSLFHGQFICVKRWNLSGQIESLSVVKGLGTFPAILVSQPGGAYIYLICYEESLKNSVEKQKEQLKVQDSVISFTDCHSTSEKDKVPVLKTHYPLPHRSDTSLIPTQVTSWNCKAARHSSTPSNFIAMCTLNGTLAVIKDENMYWSINLNHNFFDVQKLDITGNGTDEVAFCAWDGETYIMDQYENIVNFTLGEDVSAFCAGTYAVNDEGSLPCLVYVTFHNHIRLYWNIKMERLESRNFNDTVVAKLDDFNLDQTYRAFMESKDGSLDNEKIKQLTSWCLYDGSCVQDDG